LDTCPGELLKEEQCLVTQGFISHDVDHLEPMMVAYVAQSKDKGNKSNVFSANSLNILLINAVRSFVIIPNSRVIGHSISVCGTCPPQKSKRPK